MWLEKPSRGKVKEKRSEVPRSLEGRVDFIMGSMRSHWRVLSRSVMCSD